MQLRAASSDKEFFRQDKYKSLLESLYRTLSTHHYSPPSRVFMQSVEEFLARDISTLLVLGQAGSGKTLLCYYLAQMLEGKGKIPIYINLAAVADSHQLFMPRVLSEYGFDDKDIAKLKHSHEVVIIFDGYAENGQLVNLYISQQLSDWKNVQVIITCRPNYLSNWHNTTLTLYFAPFTSEKHQAIRVNTLELPDFNSDQIKDYLDQTITASSYLRSYLRSHSELAELCFNPLMLNLLVTLFSQLTEDRPLAKIYEQILKSWFHRQEQKFKSVGKLLSDEILGGRAWDYCQQLAAEMVQAGIQEIEVLPSPRLFPNKNPWSKYFNPTHSVLKLLLESAPLYAVTRYRYRFLSKGLFNFFSSFFSVSSPLSLDAHESVSVGRSVLPSTSSELSSQPTDFLSYSLITQEAALLTLLANRVTESDEYKDDLFARIDASRKSQEEAITIAAANAITILNYAQVPFSGRDFSDVSVPYADLNGAILDFTSFARAKLTKVILQNAWLRRTNFHEADLQGVHFREEPSLVFPNEYSLSLISSDDEITEVSMPKEAIVLQKKNSEISAYIINELDEITQKELMLNAQEQEYLRFPSIINSPIDMTLADNKDLVSKIISMCNYSLTRTSCEVIDLSLGPNGDWLAAIKANKVYLWELSNRRCTILSGHTDIISYILFSPNNQILASAGKDTRVRVWAVETGQALYNLSGHSKPICTMAISPDSMLLASGSQDNTIRLWKLTDGKPLHVLIGHTACVRSVIFNQASTVLVSGSDDTTVLLWSVETGQKLQVLNDWSNGVTALQFSPNGQMLASVSGSIRPGPEEDEDDNLIHLWRTTVDGMKFLRVLKGHKMAITSIQFSPLEGKLLASGSYDTHIRIWNVATGDTLHILTGDSLGNDIGIQFSPDGKSLVSWSDTDTTIRLWDIATGSILRSLIGHENGVVKAQFNPRGRTLASVNKGFTSQPIIRIWKLKTDNTSHLTNPFSAPIEVLKFTPDGKVLIASAGFDKSILLWDVATGRLLSNLRGHTHRVNCIRLHKEKKILATGSQDMTVRLWSITTYQLLHLLTGHTDIVYCVQFSRDGKILASGGLDNTIRLWSVRTGQPIYVLADCVGRIKKIWFSRDGKILVGEEHTHAIRVWGTSPGQLLPIFVKNEKTSCIQFNKERKVFAVAMENFTIQIWLIEGGFPQLRHTLSGHKQRIFFLQFSHRSHLLASASKEGNICLWELESGSILHTFYNCESEITSMKFSSDDGVLAAGNKDNLIYLWSVESGTLLYSSLGSPVSKLFTSGIVNLKFGTSDKMIISRSIHQGVYVWEWQSAGTRPTHVTELRSHLKRVEAFAFCQNGLAIGRNDSTIELWRQQKTASTPNLIWQLQWRTANALFAERCCLDKTRLSSKNQQLLKQYDDIEVMGELLSDYTADI